MNTRCYDPERVLAQPPAPPAALTSFGGLKLLGGAGRTLALAVVHADVEGVEAEGVQAGQHAAAVVAAEVQNVLLHVVLVVLVLLPVVHLRKQWTIKPRI